VSQAALDFGFSDFSHFSHAFRKAFGISPRSLLPKEQRSDAIEQAHRVRLLSLRDMSESCA
jgi:AraC-like DNA-binding protein